MSIEPAGPGTGNDLARTLRELRKAAGLSGERLAVRCAMSQAKISRIERGRTLPTVVDVERIVKALEVPPDAARELVGLARRANVEHTSLRTVFEMGVWRKQLELKALTESCQILRMFLPAMPSGLLQTPEYIRGVFEPRLPSEPLLEVEKIVRARLARQAGLDDPSRRFVFLLTRHAVT